jgi:hypothetical protein
MLRGEIQVIGEKMPRSSRCIVCLMTPVTMGWFAEEWGTLPNTITKLSRKHQLVNPLKEERSSPLPRPDTNRKEKERESTGAKEKDAPKERVRARARGRARVSLAAIRPAEKEKEEAEARDEAGRPRQVPPKPPLTLMLSRAVGFRRQLGLRMKTIGLQKIA